MQHELPLAAARTIAVHRSPATTISADANIADLGVPKNYQQI
jgi:hypothetical protein